MADPRRSSILKPPKQRAPLQEVNSLNIHHDDFTSTTVTQNIMRRVSFAGTSTIKEFDTHAESVLVCHTPAYEESFAASDSSVPSDHSSRFLSRSTISIEDQSTHPASSKGSLHEVVQTEDELFVDFGLSKPSQPAAQEPKRRIRFSIGGVSDEEESPKVQEKVPSPIPTSFFFGKEKPKPKKSVISSPQLLKIDPYSLRPKPVSTSPKLQLKRKSLARPAAQPSPKSKSPALRFAPSPNDSTSSEMELTESISGNIFVATPSPSNVATEATSQSVLTPRSMACTSVGTPDLKNKTAHDADMDFTRGMPTKILDSTDVRSSVSGDGSLHCSFRNSVMMEFPQPVTGVAIRNEQHLVTGANQGVTCSTNSFVMGLSRSLTKNNEMKSHQATIPRPEDVEATGMLYRKAESRSERGRQTLNMTENVPVAGLNRTVRDLEGMEFTGVISTLPVLEKDFSNGNRGEFDSRNATICAPEGMDFTRVIPGLPVLEGDSDQCRGLLPNQTLNDSAGMDLTEAMPSVPIVQEYHSAPTACNATLNETLNDSACMDLTEAISYVPQLHTPGCSKSFKAVPLSKTLNDSVGMEFTKVVPTAPQLHTPGRSKSFQAEPLSKTLNDSVGMEFTKVVPTAPQLHTPGRSKSFQAEPLSKTLNDSVGMEFTKVVLTAPQLHTSGLSKSFQAEPLSKTLNDSVGMEFTKVVPTAPQLHTPGRSKSFQAEPLSKTLNDSVGMEFTKVVLTAPQLHTPGFSSSFQAEPLSKTLNDSVGMEFTKTIPAAPISLSSEDNCSSNERVVAQRTLCGSVNMEIIQTVAAKQFDNTLGGATDSQSPVFDGKNTLLDSVGMEFTKIGAAPVLLDSSKPNESSKMVQESSIVTTNDTSIRRTENVTSTGLTKGSITSSLLTAATSLTVQHITQPTGIEAVVSRSESILIRTESQTQQNLPHTDVEANLPRTCNLSISRTPVQETFQTPLLDGDVASTPLQMTLTSHPLPTLPNLQLSRKRSIDQVDDAEPDEIASQVSRTNLTNTASIAPSEIAIPSSRSPSPVEQDSSTRFPGLSQSFSADRSLTNSGAAPSASPSVTDKPLTQEYHHIIPSNAMPDVTEASGCVANEVSSVPPPLESYSNPVGELSSTANFPVPVDKTMEVESVGTTTSSTSEEILRKFSTPDECNLTEVSLKTKLMSPDLSRLAFETESLFHKSIMDVSIPSMLEVSDLGIEQEVSSDARLYATLLQAENNVSVFHQDREGNASAIEESANVCREEAEVRPCNALEEKNMSVCEEVERKDIPQEHGSCRRDNLNVCEEPKRKIVEEQGALLEELEKSESRTRAVKAVEGSNSGSLRSSILPNGSPCLIEPDRRSIFDRSSTNTLEVSRTVDASRPAEEIIRTHRVEYRKRERCNWTSQKLRVGGWSFYYLDDSVELRIKVEESSRNQLLSGFGGRVIPLFEGSSDGLWYIGGRLLYQKLSSKKWASRLQKTADVLSLVEDINRVANDVEKFKTALAYLQITKNIDITNDWISFDVLSRKTSNIWFKVNVDCRDVLNLQQSHITIENIIGESRQADIQNLVTCVKKGPYILKNYVAVVEEYLETIERIQ